MEVKKEPGGTVRGDQPLAVKTAGSRAGELLDRPRPRPRPILSPTSSHSCRVLGQFQFPARGSD